MVVITDMIVSSKAAEWKRSALMVKQVGGRELHSEDCQRVVIRVCDKIRILEGFENQELHTKIWNCMLLLHISHRKIQNVVHLSSIRSCCMNEVVEKGRLVQHRTHAYWL
jgi:hypothetical protein